MCYTSDKAVVTKTFQELHFKMTLPEIREFSDRIEFFFKFMYKNIGEHVDSVLERCVFTDKLGVVHSTQTGYTLILRGKSGNIKSDIEVGNRKIFLRDGKVEFVFLCSNRKKVLTVYDIDSTHKTHLKEIKVYKMSDKEYQECQDIIKSLLKESGMIKENTGKQTEEGQKEYISSNIREYSDALRKEIHHLKLGKGKRYKIVNGEKIHVDRGIYSYMFEMETELHLPDDAPVVVDTATGLHAVGSVLVCEDFQIMLLLDKDLGDKVRSASLMVEPWKLLEALDERINTLNPQIHRLAIRLMEDGPRLGTNEDITRIPKGQEEVKERLKQDEIVVVWGPPGTGKTYTMAEIAKEYVQNGKSVLIVSHSNVSVDGVINKVVEHMIFDMKSYLESGKVFRFGYVRDDTLSRNPYASSFNYALGKCKSYATELEKLLSVRDKLRAENRIKSEEYDKIEKNIKSIRSEIRKEERKYVERAQLIGTTISKVIIDPLFAERQYDLVMFDEISMAYVPQVVAAAALAREKFLCVGDFKQLPPISQNPDASLLQKDIFAYLHIVDTSGNMYWHPWLVMLNEQRRMYPDIAGFSNKYVYQKLLKNHPDAIRKNIGTIDKEPLSGDALHLINLFGTYCAAEKNGDGSRFNILSAVVAFGTAVNAKNNEIENVGIITPYAAQAKLIRAMIQDYYGKEKPDISCATVHQFQGSESDVLVFDAVESYPKSAVGYLMGKDLGTVERLINVAVTRAKGKFIAVANDKFWTNMFEKSPHILYKLFTYIRNLHHVVEQKNKELVPYLDSLDFEKTVYLYTDEQEAISVLEDDLTRVKGRIELSLPSGKLGEHAGKIIRMLEDANAKGIDVFAKSNDYKGLPDMWKKYCTGTENATFPLIFLDDAVAWYGLPVGAWEFKVDKTTSLVTMVHVMIRFSGKKTIDMLKALTEFETVQVGSNKRSLVQENIFQRDVNKKVEKIGHAHGLAGFIEKKEFCPICKKPMILTKNRKGVFYLRCPNMECKQTRLLEPELINWYLESTCIGCPQKDGGELKGRVGQYGPYIQCSMGHILKPDEI